MKMFLLGILFIAVGINLLVRDYARFKKGG